MPDDFWWGTTPPGNRNTGPMAQRRAGRWRRQWQAAVPPAIPVQTEEEIANSHLYFKPTLPANRNTGPMALRWQGILRRQWVPPRSTAAPPTDTRVSQEAIEVLLTATGTAVRLSQFAIEVLRRSNPEGGSQVIIVGM